MGTTHEDIARLSQVSRAAVSQVLKNPDHPRFPLATRRRIIEVARQLNYVPNRLATSLRQGSTQTLGLVMPFNVPELLDVTQQTANELDYAFIPQFTFRPDPKAERRALTTLLERRVDGIIWQPSADAEQYEGLIDQIRESRTSLVFLERAVDGLDADVVLSDTRHGAHLAVDHLRAQGYEQIVYLTRDLTYRLRQRRLEDFLEISGGASHRVIHQDTYLTVLRELLSEFPFPLGLYCDSDFDALRVLQVIESLGLSVPGDVGIIGLGDTLIGGTLRTGELARPTVTAVRRHHGRIARVCVQRLVEHCTGKIGAAHPERISIQPDLIARASTMQKPTEP